MTTEWTSYVLAVCPVQQFHGNMISQCPASAMMIDAVPLEPSAKTNPFFIRLFLVHVLSQQQKVTKTSSIYQILNKQVKI